MPQALSPRSTHGTRRGLRGKKAPSNRHILDINDKPKPLGPQQRSLNRTEGTIALGLGLSPRRNTSKAKVDLAALLQKESLHKGSSSTQTTRASTLVDEPYGRGMSMSMSLSTLGMSMHSLEPPVRLSRISSANELPSISDLQFDDYKEAQGPGSAGVAPQENPSFYSQDSGLSQDSSHSQDSFAGDGSFNFEGLPEEVLAEQPQQRISRLSLRGSFRMSFASDNGARKSVRETFEQMVSNAGDGANKDDATYEMEIFPGHFVPFRNANEVWKAVEQGNFLECTCLECELPLVSVVDCEHVLCPECHMVNPVFEWPEGVTPNGAGMGLKKEWVDQQQQQGQPDMANPMRLTTTSAA